MTHELDLARFSSNGRATLSAASLAANGPAVRQSASRRRDPASIWSRIGDRPSQSALRIIETTWRLWREPAGH